MIQDFYNLNLYDVKRDVRGKNPVSKNSVQKSEYNSVLKERGQIPFYHKNGIPFARRRGWNRIPFLRQNKIPLYSLFQKYGIALHM